MTRPDRREVLADDLRRLAGLAEAAVDQAQKLGLDVPDDAAECVSTWRRWGRRLREGTEGGEAG